MIYVAIGLAPDSDLTLADLDNTGGLSAIIAFPYTSDTSGNADGAISIYRHNPTDPPCAPPQKLVMVNSGNNGEHPILQWNANIERDLDYYAIYKGYQNSKSAPINWNSTPSATTTNTTWTDLFTTINTSAPSSVHYRITAMDLSNQESN